MSGVTIATPLLDRWPFYNPQLRRCLREGHPAFAQKSSQVLDDGRAPRDQPVPHPVDGLQIELIVRLDRDKAHAFTLDCFGDGFGIH
jgi:hypothetical protein